MTNSYTRTPQRGRRSPGARGRFNTNTRRPAQGRGRGARPSAFMDVSKFVNKTVEEEKVVSFVPKHSFTDFGFEPLLEKNITSKGYTNPTPIQDEAIGHILQGRDVVGIANTGTGKTAAFVLPLLNKVIKNPREKVLVVAPTRELAVQIEEELRDFAKGSKLFSVLCIGGANIGKQKKELRDIHHFVIGTPGRLKDLVDQRSLNLGGFKTVVLDEADRMLDMGFINDVKYLLAEMPTPRHTLFFSATLSSEIERLIGEFLREPVRISVKTRDTAKNVHQDIVRVSYGTNKIDVLESLLREPGFGKVLVFGRTKHGVEKLSKELGKRGFKSESIHGNKSQRERQRALDLFKKDHAQVLIATDVAARGLDIRGVTHVINFDLPATYEDYIHRIGRTGRGEMLGKALTFIE